MNTAGDPGLCDGVLSVGAYITDDTYLADYGAQLYEQDNLHYFSSRGPREDGGFEPDIVAPGAAISTIPMWQAQGVPRARPARSATRCSTARRWPSRRRPAPAALLVSAAKAAGAQHQPAQIRKALLSTPRFLDRPLPGATSRASGLINVGAAWNLLRENLKTVDISSSVPVNTVAVRLPGDAGHRRRVSTTVRA